MKCFIYRSAKISDTYLYLDQEDGFDVLPPEASKAFGKPELVLALDLAPDRTLAREDVNTVISNLEQQGWHLQLPPDQNHLPGSFIPDYHNE